MDFQGQKRMWESFRAEARRKDDDVEQRLSKLEATAHKVDGTTFSEFGKLHDSIQHDLHELAAVIASMNDIVSSNVTRGGSEAELSAMVQATRRFDDLLKEKDTALKRINLEAKKRKERSELLHNVHTEIAIHDGSAELRHLANEGDSLKHTQRATRNLIAQSDANRLRLQQQRERFVRMADNVLAIAEQVPVVKDLLKRIDARRRREAVVVAIVVALCLLIVLLCW